MLLVSNHLEQVFYLDGDNSMATLKNRNIHYIKQQHGNRFRYFCGLKKSELHKIIQTLQKIDLSNCLVVFDSIKNFIDGDRDKNRDVSKVMEVLKSLRNKGATVVFLHHANKKQKDFESDFAGSSAFSEDTSNAFKLSRNNHQEAILLVPYKARVGELHSLAFKYNNHTLTQLDFEEASVNEEDLEIKDEILSYLSDNQSNVKARAHTRTLMAVSKLGYARNKVNAVLKKFINKNWSVQKQIENNRTIYTLLVNEVAVTTYDHHNNTSPSLQPIQQNSVNKSNMSNKSYSMASNSIGAHLDSLNKSIAVLQI